MVSVESLLSEVTTLFSNQLTLKTADELFFGDKMLYHYHSNDGSKRGISGLLLFTYLHIVFIILFSITLQLYSYRFSKHCQVIIHFKILLELKVSTGMLLSILIPATK